MHLIVQLTAMAHEQETSEDQSWTPGFVFRLDRKANACPHGGDDQPWR